MARPKLQLDEEKIEELASYGCTGEEISAVMNCAVSTLYDRFSDSIKKGHERRNCSVRRAQYDSAVNKGNVTMQIWLGKQYLNQREIKTIDVNTITPEQALAILAADAGTDSRN